jgi:predicted ATPase with chaperone activity
VAATVAALDGSRAVGEEHLREALEFRHGLAVAQPEP